jgi:hypothetical protein
MNPNPLAALNHLTVPSAILVSSLSVLLRRFYRPGGRAGNQVSLELGAPPKKTTVETQQG